MTTDVRPVPLYVVISTYGPSAQLRREAAMPDHLQYLRDNAYRLRFAGPMLGDDGRTPTGSFALVETADRAGAEGFIAAEAFNRAGMFARIEISRIATAVGSRQAELDGDPTRLLYLCRWTGAESPHLPGESTTRAAAPAVRVLEGGPLLTDDGSRLIGGLYIIEASDRQTAQRFLAVQVSQGRDSPIDLMVSRWRFGQALSEAPSAHT